jgi:hypothetical protein
MAEFSRRFQVAGAQRGSAFLPCRRRDLNLIFALQFERTVDRTTQRAFRTSACRLSGCAGERRWRAARRWCISIWMET